MPILRAYAFPHPPLAVPAVGRGDVDNIRNTLAAFDTAAREIAELAPETIIFITPHNVIYADYFHISPGTGAKGDFSRFGAPGARIETEYDTELAEEIARLADAGGLRAGGAGEKDARLDHGVMVPMWFINQRYSNYRTVRISQSGMGPAEHYRFGRLVAEAVGNTGRKAVFVASGDMSHKLTASGPYGFAKEGPEFDKGVTEAFASADFLSLFSVSENLRERAAECGYNSFVTLAGCFDRRKVDGRLLSYEGPFGVGYAVAAFTPGEPDASRDFLDRYNGGALEKARERQGSEDIYRALARQSLEYAVNNGKTLPLPDGLPAELLDRKAGAFVSLHKDGRLRGCIGTIAPTAANLALEIIRNAVSAGLSDYRFDPVQPSELPFLTYKVDVLSEPEAVADPRDLDVKRYGVIVSSGHKRGLLLPDLEGVDTVEQQIDIARQKGGISKNADVTLQRFEVVRHE